MINYEIMDKIIQIEYTSGRIIKVKILLKEKEIGIIQTYEPQMCCQEEGKDAFRKILEDTATGEYTVIMGDFKAKVGMETPGQP